MKARSFKQLALWFLLSGLGHGVAAETASIKDGLAASTRCGYDLAKLMSILTAADVEPFLPSGVKVGFYLQLRHETKPVSAQLVISCTDPLNTTENEIVPDAKTVIQEEDAGGRYFRHVASQKLIKGRNWRINVAAIDYALSDAQKIRKNEFFACNADAISPCILLTINKPQRSSKNDFKLVGSIFEKIAVKRTNDNIVDTPKNASSTASAPASQ